MKNLPLTNLVKMVGFHFKKRDLLLWGFFLKYSFLKGLWYHNKYISKHNLHCVSIDVFLAATRNFPVYSVPSEKSKSYVACTVFSQIFKSNSLSFPSPCILQVEIPTFYLVCLCFTLLFAIVNHCNVCFEGTNYQFSVKVFIGDTELCPIAWRSMTGWG